jgi:hypothetical protein
MQKLVTALRSYDDQKAFAAAMNPQVAQLAVHPNGSHGTACSVDALHVNFPCSGVRRPGNVPQGPVGSRV